MKDVAIARHNLEVVVEALSAITQARLSIPELARMTSDLRVRGHLAILTDPYIDLILAGQKTIESRFAKNRIPPYGQIRSGDLLFLKQSSGPIRGVSLVEEVRFLGPLNRSDVQDLFQQFAAGLCLRGPYREIKSDSRYASLVFLAASLPVTPRSVVKKDRRPWIVLHRDQQSLFW